MSSSFRIARQYQSDRLDAEVVARAARRCSFKVISQDQSQLTLKARISLWSFGERIIVELSNLDGDTLLDITSRCVLPTQEMDWGKNERNVQRLFTEIDCVQVPKTEFDVVDICGGCGYLMAGIESATCPECGKEVTRGQVQRRSTAASFRAVLRVTFWLTAVELFIAVGLEYLGFAVSSMFGGSTFAYFALKLAFFNSAMIIVSFGISMVAARIINRFRSSRSRHEG